jgi:hypothetical protein
MKNTKSVYYDLIEHIKTGNMLEANNLFNELLSEKIHELLEMKKVHVATEMFNTQECQECDDEYITEEEFNMLSPEEQDEYEKLEEANAENKAKKNVHMTKMGKSAGIKSARDDINKNYSGNSEGDRAMRAHVAGDAIKTSAKDNLRRGRLLSKMNKEHIEQVNEIVGVLKAIDKADKENQKVRELKGNQHKIDANKNGKLDAMDFKLLRKKKNVKEAYADAYAAKKAAEMKKAKNDAMAAAKKEYENTGEAKGKLNKKMFMKNEQAENLEELSNQTIKSLHAMVKSGQKRKNNKVFDKFINRKKQEKETANKTNNEEFAVNEEESDYERDYKMGGATRGEYRQASRNFQARQRKMQTAAPSAAPSGSHSVHINGKKWKSFSSQGHATNVAKKLAAKGGERKFTIHKDD